MIIVFAIIVSYRIYQPSLIRHEPGRFRQTIRTNRIVRRASGNCIELITFVFIYIYEVKLIRFCSVLLYAEQDNISPVHALKCYSVSITHFL